MSAPPVLEVRGVTKAYDERPVLRGIDLVVREHEAVALIGASGSGKSTLLRCINLLEPLEAGRIFLSGEEITHPKDVNAVRRRIEWKELLFSVPRQRRYGMHRSIGGRRGRCYHVFERYSSNCQNAFASLGRIKNCRSRTARLA